MCIVCFCEHAIGEPGAETTGPDKPGERFLDGPENDGRVLGVEPPVDAQSSFFPASTSQVDWSLIA
jgi:hypothetical protein